MKKPMLRITYCYIDVVCDLDVKAMDFSPMGGCHSCKHICTFPAGTKKFLSPQEVPWDQNDQTERRIRGLEDSSPPLVIAFCL